MIEVAVFSYFAFLALFAFSLDLRTTVLPALVTGVLTAVLVHLVLGARLAAAIRASTPGPKAR